MNHINTLNSSELDLFKKLDTPLKIQEYLDGCSYRPEDVLCCPRQVISEQKAHCFDGSLFAAAALSYHHYQPKIMKLYPNDRDDSHMLTVFKVNNHWGAIAKSNFPGLTFREPVYKSIRELVMSYFDCYFNEFKEKTLRGYGVPVDLKRFTQFDWITNDFQLNTIVTTVRSARKITIFNNDQITKLNPVSKKFFQIGMQGVNPAGLFKKQ